MSIGIPVTSRNIPVGYAIARCDSCSAKMNITRRVDMQAEKTSVKGGRLKMSGGEISHIEKILGGAGWTWKNGLRKVYCQTCSNRKELTTVPKTIPFTPTAPLKDLPPLPPVTGPVQITTDGLVKAAEAVEKFHNPAKLISGPLPSERRRIADALEEGYDVDKQRYRGNQSDLKVAQLLGFPTAFVKEVRELLFGALDRNEEMDKQSRVIPVMEKRIAQAESDLLAALDKVTAIQNDLARQTTILDILRKDFDTLKGKS